MATNTEKLNLKLPSQEDFYNIDDINENFQKVDDFAKDLDGNVQEVLKNHTSNTANPHGVTKEQVGLGNVPNVATNDQTPVYSEASTLATLESGEKLSVAFGKIKKAITDLIAHIGDTRKHVGKATGGGAFIGADSSAEAGGGAVGNSAKTTGLGGFAGGDLAFAKVGGGAVGYGTSATDGGGAIGYGSSTSSGFAGGFYAKTFDNAVDRNPIDAIQLGTGENTIERTLQVYGYQMMDANGVIPTGRLPIYSGSYQGADGYGATKPNILTFPFKPRIVFISHSSSVASGTNTAYYPTLPLIYGCSMGFVSLSSSTREAPYNIPLHLTWEENTLTWYYPKTDGNGVHYQLNLPGETYYYVAIG